MVSLVTVCLVVLCFFFLFVSVLGDVVAVDGESLVVAVPGVGPPLLEALMIGAGQHRSWLVKGKRWLDPRWTGHCG